MGFISKLEKRKNKIWSFLRKKFENHPLIKFSVVVLILGGYFLFVAHSHGVKEGLFISILTWSFFVFCTPIADAGILIDFPMRLVTGIKMHYSEIIVWVIAGGLNVFAHIYNPEIYNQTVVLSLFKHIIEEPFPYWGIIILSLIGTFMSVYIGDELIDSGKEKKKESFLKKHKVIIFIVIVLLIIALYDFLLNKLGVSIPLV